MVMIMNDANNRGNESERALCYARKWYVLLLTHNEVISCPCPDLAIKDPGD